MALPTKEEILERLPAKAPAIMDPKSYPLEYAENLLMENQRILPECLYQEITQMLSYPFSVTYINVTLKWWAVTKENENLYEFATVLADIYLERHNIIRMENIPVMTSQDEWMSWLVEVLAT
jgi:hypothetical protein